MNKKVLISAIFAVLVLIPLATYIKFTAFKPANSEPRDVKGSKDSRDEAFPFPSDSTVISSDNTTKNRHITLSTFKTPAEAGTFYAVVMNPKGWILETKTEEPRSYSVVYKKGSERVSITAIRQNANSSLVTIDLYSEE